MTFHVTEEQWRALSQRIGDLEKEKRQLDQAQQDAPAATPTLGVGTGVCQQHTQQLEQHSLSIARQGSELSTLADRVKMLARKVGLQDGDSFRQGCTPAPHDLDGNNGGRLHLLERNHDRLAGRIVGIEDTGDKNSELLRSLDASVELLGGKISKVDGMQTDISELEADLKAETVARCKAQDDLESSNIHLSTKIDKSIALVEPVKEQYKQVMSDIATLQHGPRLESQLADVKQTADLASFEVKKIVKMERKLNDIFKRITEVENLTIAHEKNGTHSGQRTTAVEKDQASIKVSLKSHTKELTALAEGLTSIRQLVSTQQSATSPGCLSNLEVGAADAVYIFQRLDVLEKCNTAERLHNLEQAVKCSQRTPTVEIGVMDKHSPGNGSAPSPPNGQSEKAVSSPLGYTDIPALQESLCGMKRRLIALEEIMCSQRFTDLDAGVANIHKLLASATQQGKSRTANTNERIDSIDRQLKTCMESTATLGGALEARIVRLERGAGNGGVKTAHQSSNSIPSMPDGVANKPDGFEERLGCLSVAQGKLAKEVAAGNQSVTELRELYDADIRWLRQQNQVLNLAFENGSAERRRNEVKMKMNADRVALEAAMYFTKLLGLLGTLPDMEPMVEDAWKQVEEDRKHLRWWTKQLDGAQTKEDLQPMIEAVRSLSKGTTVPAPYADHTNFPKATARVAWLIKVVRAGLPDAATSKCLESHRESLAQAPANGEVGVADENSSSPGAVSPTASAACDTPVGQKKRKTQTENTEKQNGDAKDGPQTKKVKTEDASAS